MVEKIVKMGELANFHLGIAVRDLDDAMNKLAKTLGLKPWNIWTCGPGKSLNLRDITVHGKLTTQEQRIAQTQIGKIGIELLMPLRGRSVYEEHLERKGEGIHHISFTVPTLEELEQIIKELTGRGAEIIQSGKWETGRYYYLDIKTSGLILEFNTGSLGKPERIFSGV